MPQGLVVRFGLGLDALCKIKSNQIKSNPLDGRKVREWLQIRGPVGFGAYEAAGYLQVVASRTTRIRLAQFRTGSHWLGVETGLWANLPREQRRCKRCSDGGVDDAELGFPSPKSIMDTERS